MITLTNVRQEGMEDKKHTLSKTRPIVRLEDKEGRECKKVEVVQVVRCIERVLQALK